MRLLLMSVIRTIPTDPLEDHVCESGDDLHSPYVTEVQHLSVLVLDKGKVREQHPE